MSGRALLIGAGSTRSSARSTAFLAAALSLFGLLLVGSVGDGALGGGEPYGYARKQAFFIAVAAAAAFFTSRFDYRRLLRLAPWILGGTWALLIGVLFAGEEQMGARRWFDVPGVGHLQPSEIAKLTLIVWCGAYAVGRGERIRAFWTGAAPGLLGVAVTAGLVLAEKDLGTTLLLAVIGAVSLFVSGARLVHLMPPIAMGAPALIIVMSGKFAYIRDRLEIYRKGFQDRSATGQVDQALRALGSGGWFGRGFGDARSHLGWVPQNHNDFILAAVGEQTGFVGAAAVLTAFVLIFLHGMRIAAASKDRFGFTLAFGGSFLIALQAAVNVAVATNVVPPKGINLPFVSYGGSSMILLGACVGLVCSVARVAAAEEDAEAARAAEASATPSPEESVAPDAAPASALAARAA
ncbi:MAG TPA: FtsW/RodA/SpoVE family cell cycle protein [Planctomycetota bacterium]|nr:FtsW/RodA/SpoVE family cell cycle protein [Planctomycetota bacterium]